MSEDNFQELEDAGHGNKDFGFLYQYLKNNKDVSKLGK